MGVDALYLHVPFCAAKCRYCDFDSRACHDAAAFDAYAHAAEACVCWLGSLGVLSACRTAYIGGGTPTVLGARLPKIVAAVRAAAPLVTELSCEANPESLAPELAHALAAAGTTRISLGVQSLDDDELKALGRIHTAARARQAVAAAQAAGLDVSVDLMCGIPLQTKASWRRTLADAVRLGTGHVSVYPLTVEEGTELDRLVNAGAFPEPDEDFQAWCMEEARRTLSAAKLIPYEVASYARPGKRCRHNIAYWTGRSYLGLGRSAASMLDRATYDGLAGALGLPQLDSADAAARLRFTQVGDAFPGPAGDGARNRAGYEVERLTAREATAEDLMLGMRLSDGLSRAQLRAAASLVGEKPLRRAIETACAEGLAVWKHAASPTAFQEEQCADARSDCGGTLESEKRIGARAVANSSDRSNSDRLVPTRDGWLLGNELYGLFWDLAAGA